MTSRTSVFELFFSCPWFSAVARPAVVTALLALGCESEPVEVEPPMDTVVDDTSGGSEAAPFGRTLRMASIRFSEFTLNGARRLSGIVTRQVRRFRSGFPRSSCPRSRWASCCRRLVPAGGEGEHQSGRRTPNDVASTHSAKLATPAGHAPRPQPPAAERMALIAPA